MPDEFNDLYNMLSTDREDVRKIKKDFEKEISILLGNVRSYSMEKINISKEYDPNTDFTRYKMDDISVRNKMALDEVEYKIALLQGYLSELNLEKKFLRYRREREEEMSKDDYLTYVKDDNYRSSKVSSWYQDFIQTK